MVRPAVRWAVPVVAFLLVATSGIFVQSASAIAVDVSNDAAFRVAFADTNTTEINLTADFTQDCFTGTYQRTDGLDLVISGNGHTSGGIVVTAGKTLTVTQSTVSGNQASCADCSMLGAQGGGISAETVVLRNSTVTNNTTSGPTTAGGGISAATTTLTNSTLVTNSAAIGANIATGGTITAVGSVVALPQGGNNCVVPMMGTTSNGFNFSDDSSCGLAAGTDRQSAGNPMLGALANNGGPTQTRVPSAGSPLIDAIPSGNCALATDQRGISRPQAAGCDIAAVEVVPSVPVCPASAALLPPVPTDGPGAVLILGAAPFALLRLLRRKPGGVRVKGRAAATVVLAGMAVLVLAACQGVKPPAPIC